MKDAVEKLARLLDPQSWRVMDEGLASMLRKHKGRNIGYDPENFKHPQSIKRAEEIIDTLKSLGWLSPDQLAARDAEVTRMALERAAGYHQKQITDIDRTVHNASTHGIKQCAIERVFHTSSIAAILALAPPATGIKPATSDGAGKFNPGSD